MNLNTSYNICEDWGWFIDTENYEPIQSFIKLEKLKKNRKQDNNYYNRIDKFYEHRYPDIEYKKNEKYVEILQMENIPIIGENEEYNICKIGSTTLITVLLTYLIYFVL